MLGSADLVDQLLLCAFLGCNTMQVVLIGQGNDRRALTPRCSHMLTTLSPTHSASNRSVQLADRSSDWVQAGYVYTSIYIQSKVIHVCVECNGFANAFIPQCLESALQCIFRGCALNHCQNKADISQSEQLLAANKTSKPPKKTRGQDMNTYSRTTN